VTRARSILLALCFAWASPLPVRAQAPATPAPDGGAAPVDVEAPAEPPAVSGPAAPAATATEALRPVEAPAPPAAPPAPAERIPIVRYEISGSPIDPEEKLQALLASVAPLGEPFVESGPSDEIGKPLGTIPRVTAALDAIGYRAAVTVRQAGGVATLAVALAPYERVRYVFVSGNKTIRQDEIQRRISIRPGRPLPPRGAERANALERERGRIIDFLRGEGYFEATVRLEARPGASAPGSADLYVTVDLGPAYPLGPITFLGNRALTADEMDPMFRHFDWYTLWIRRSAFTQKQLRDDIEKLTKRYRELGYLGARITTDFSIQRSVDREAKHVRLNIRINERKRVAVAFEGNANRSSSALLAQTTLETRGAYDDYEADASADAIQRDYQQHGYFFARVEWRRERLSADEERIVFIIDEGPELRVRGIQFEGNQSLPSRELAAVVSVRKYPWLGLGAGGFVTARQMQGDAERLVEHYKGKGFLEVKARATAATSPEALGQIGAVAAGADTASRDAGEIFVRFTIEEGPQIVLASSGFRTDDGRALPYDLNFLRDSMRMRPGLPYTPAAVREDGKRLMRLLGDAGYPNASVDPQVTRNGNQVELTWLCKLGPQVRVGPIFVRGNFVTKPGIILQWIPIRSGDTLTTTAVERGQRNLGFLQLFNNASPISFPGQEEKRPVVPMVVEVEERYDQYSVVHFGAGVSTEQKPPDSSLPFGTYLRAGYENRDLLGHGWQFNSTATYGTSLFRGNVSFLDRRFFGSLFRLNVALSYLSQATVRLGDIRQGSGSIGFSREMYPGVDATLAYNLRNTTHTEALLRSAGPSWTQQNVTLGTTVGSLSGRIEFLRLDNRLLPTRGFRLELTAEMALPILSAPLRPLPIDIGDDTFFKVGIHSLTVLPLGRYLYLRHGFRFDQGFPLGGSSVLPKVERFFAGGDTTLRGYALDRARTEVVTPIDPATGMPIALSRVDYRPLGGNLRILQNLDLQFPISPPWYGSVFMDNGVVADSLDGLTAAKFRHGIGIAPLVIRLPIGDISLGWAWPLDPGPGDTKIGVFLVNVGLLF
jgi:outer membrane protein insertion porin family